MLTQKEFEEKKYRFVVQHHKKVVTVTAHAPRRMHEQEHIVSVTRESRDAAMQEALEHAMAHFVAARLD